MQKIASLSMREFLWPKTLSQSSSVMLAPRSNVSVLPSLKGELDTIGTIRIYWVLLFKRNILLFSFRYQQETLPQLQLLKKLFHDHYQIQFKYELIYPTHTTLHENPNSCLMPKHLCFLKSNHSKIVLVTRPTLRVGYSYRRRIMFQQV